MPHAAPPQPQMQHPSPFSVYLQCLAGNRQTQLSATPGAGAGTSSLLRVLSVRLGTKESQEGCSLLLGQFLRPMFPAASCHLPD